MRINSRVGGLLGVLLALVVTAGCAAAGPLPAGQRGAAGAAADPVRSFSEFLDESAVRAMTRAQWAMIAREDAIIVLNSWDYRLIPLLKRDNPHVQVWVYKDLSGIRSDDCTTSDGACGSCPAGVSDSQFLSSGIGYCWVLRHGPAWLLTTVRTGRPLQFRGYPHTWETDYGSGSYQQQWLTNVVADVRAHGWDGVAVDNALSTADAYGVAAQYPTDEDVQAATYSALRTIGSGLRRARIRAVFNVGFATMFAGLWRRWLTAVGGLEQQYYLSYTAQPDAAGATWLDYQAEISACADLDKSCWFHVGHDTSGVSSRTAAYGLASYLLSADRQQAFAVGAALSGGRLGWQLGVPVRPMIGEGRAFLRYFTRGVAIANPSGSSVVVRLDGFYRDGRGRRVTQIVLGPASGVVLRAASAQISANQGF